MAEAEVGTTPADWAKGLNQRIAHIETSCATVRVVNPRKPGEYRVINKAEYDPELHGKLWDDVKGEPEDVGPDDEEQPESIDCTPGAENIAADLGVNLALVKGTGKGGRITAADVKRFAGK